MKEKDFVSKREKLTKKIHAVTNTEETILKDNTAKETDLIIRNNNGEIILKRNCGIMLKL